MKLVVLNGSPKGMTSVTMQYVLFLRKKLPQHEFTILNACQEIKKLEGDEQAFLEVIKTVAESDGVLWAFPLYYMLVHGDYKRFIELVFARAPGPPSKASTPRFSQPRFTSSTIRPTSIWAASATTWA